MIKPSVLDFKLMNRNLYHPKNSYLKYQSRFQQPSRINLKFDMYIIGLSSSDDPWNSLISHPRFNQKFYCLIRLNVNFLDDSKVFCLLRFSVKLAKPTLKPKSIYNYCQKKTTYEKNEGNQIIWLKTACIIFQETHKLS